MNDDGDIPRAHPETSEEAFARIEANLWWENREDAELVALHVSNEVDNVLWRLELRRKLREEAEVIYDALTALGFVIHVAYGSLRIESADWLDPDALETLPLPLREQLEGLCDERSGAPEPQHLPSLS